MFELYLIDETTYAITIHFTPLHFTPLPILGTIPAFFAVWTADLIGDTA